MRKKYLLIFGFVFAISGCSKDPLEDEIYKALKEDDHLKVATVCASYRGERYQKECIESRNRSEEEILKILGEKKEFPFMKLIIPPDKDNKIREFLKKDIYMGIKYRIIWNEVAEKN